jgi:hypothetical protein
MCKLTKEHLPDILESLNNSFMCTKFKLKFFIDPFDFSFKYSLPGKLNFSLLILLSLTNEILSSYRLESNIEIKGENINTNFLITIKFEF